MRALLALLFLWSLSMTLPKDTSLFRDLAPRYMDRLMADFPWTEQDAAAALGSAGVESAGFRLMQEVNPTSGRGGLGPFQWTGPRRVEYETWLARKGAKANDFEASYGFLFRELKGSEKATVENVRRAESLRTKVIAFERAFERAGVPAWDKRLEWAELALAAWRARSSSEKAKNDGKIASTDAAKNARAVEHPAPLPPPPDIEPIPTKPPEGGFFVRLLSTIRANMAKGT